MQRVYKYIIAFVLVFILPLSLALAQSGAIKGKVRDSEGALPGATVSAGLKMVLTNRQGEFSLSISPGSYNIYVTHSGYKKIVQEVKVESGNNLALEFMMIPNEEMGEVVVLGSRSHVQRSNLNTPVPVDVFSARQLLQTGQTNLTQMLHFSAPSFNAGRQLVHEPITLRGLDPDQVLILVNGARYHSMAFINEGRIQGMLGRGTAANDLNSIPFSAIEKIEILRDGASAQYGSDAIAGVINIILKKSTGKTIVNFHAGQYYKGDGENLTLSINRGIAFNKKGFLHFSADFRFRNPTYRGGEYKGTVYKDYPINASFADSIRVKSLDDLMVQQRNFDRMKVGGVSNAALSSLGMVMNGGYPIGDWTELFWTIAVNGRKSTHVSVFRFPKQSVLVNPLLFPDGFRGLINHHIGDISGIGGFKGTTKNQWHWEYGSAFGNNTGNYYSGSTNNASQYFDLGSHAPTKFYTGSLVFQQLTNNIHFSKAFPGGTEGLNIGNVGFGAEWRMEHYRIKAGEEASWENYDSLGRKRGGAQHGLIFRPENMLAQNRNVAGAYLDLETGWKDRLLLNLASRFEYYSDFGRNLAGKLAARYQFSERFALRGSVSNGFRAPGLQQSSYSSTQGALETRGGMLVPVTKGIFRNGSEVARALGIPNLQAERSINLSGGLTATLLNRIRLTIDAYWIQIKNRIVLSGGFDTRTNSEVKYLLLNYKDIELVQFFANAVNTRTRGVDIVMNGNWRIQNGDLQVMLAANFTRTRLFGAIQMAGKLRADSLNTNTVFDRVQRIRMENGQPGDKTMLSLYYKTGRLGFLLRNTRFGKTAVATNPNDVSFDEFFFARILTDVSIQYSPKPWLTITAGANNVLDVYPDRIRNYLNTGEGLFIYSPEASPFGFNGGYYFVALAFQFASR